MTLVLVNHQLLEEEKFLMKWWSIDHEFMARLMHCEQLFENSTCIAACQLLFHFVTYTKL